MAHEAPSLFTLLKRSGRLWVVVAVVLLGFVGLGLALANASSYTSPFTYGQ
jgi:hypothetical protein